MNGMIVLSDMLNATDNDILSGTRLQTVPTNGSMIFELQASAWSLTNNAKFTIQLPSGDTPINGVTIPAGESGELSYFNKYATTLVLGQGGHCVFSVMITGTVEVVYRITYIPA